MCLTYVEEAERSETRQIQRFPASQQKIGEKGRLEFGHCTVDDSEKFGGIERFGQEEVAANPVMVPVSLLAIDQTGEKDDWDVLRAWIAAHLLGDRRSICPWENDVQENEVRHLVDDLGQRPVTITDGHDGVASLGQHLRHNIADMPVIVYKNYFRCHGGVFSEWLD